MAPDHRILAGCRERFKSKESYIRMDQDLQEDLLEGSQGRGWHRMLERINKFEQIVYYVLLILLAFVILLSVIELVYLIFIGLISDFSFRLDNQEILTIFGFFLLILIGIELLDTIKAYIAKHEIHVEVIVLLAIIAVARKIILLDPFVETALSDLTLIGLGIIAICLSAGYYLIKKAGTYTP